VRSDSRALLLERIKGRVWMHPPATPEEQLSVAQDFIRHLTRLTNVAAAEVLGPCKVKWR
jgi:hypothetical protein